MDSNQAKELSICPVESEPLTKPEQEILDDIMERRAWQRDIAPFCCAIVKNYIGWVAGLIVSAFCFFGMDRNGPLGWLWWASAIFGVLASAFSTWREQDAVIRKLVRELIAYRRDDPDSIPQFDFIETYLRHIGGSHYRCGFFFRNVGRNTARNPHCFFIIYPESLSGEPVWKHERCPRIVRTGQTLRMEQPMDA